MGSYTSVSMEMSDFALGNGHSLKVLQFFFDFQKKAAGEHEELRKINR